MVQGVTPAHKGLAPSRLIFYLSVKEKMPMLGTHKTYGQCGFWCFTEGPGVPGGTAKSFGSCFFAGQDKTKTKRFR